MSIARAPVHATPLAAACVLLAGCTAASLILDVDPEVERHSTVYPIDQPGGPWLEKRLDVSFGPYRVAGADLGRTRTEHGKITEQRRHVNWLRFLLFEDQGLLNTTSSREDTKERGLTYRFEIAGRGSWTAKCTLRSLLRHWEAHSTFARNGEDQYDSGDALRSASLTCVYTQPGERDWVLSVETDAAGQTVRVRLTDQREEYVAESVNSTLVVGDDGRRAHLPFPVPTGYEWVRGHETLGTLVTYHEGRRLLLGRDCPAATADLLAMGSSGLVLHDLLTHRD